MKYAVDSREDPSLANLTKKAVEILSKNPNGYFLFVEGKKSLESYQMCSAPVFVLLSP